MLTGVLRSTVETVIGCIEAHLTPGLLTKQKFIYGWGSQFTSCLKSTLWSACPAYISIVRMESVKLCKEKAFANNWKPSNATSTSS